MTGNELIDRVLRMTRSVDNDRFYIIDLLNDALHQLTDGAKLQDDSTLNVVSGTAEYALPADFKAPIALIEGSIAEPNVIYELLNINEVEWGYAIYEGNIIIKPEPTEDKILQFYYYKYPTIISEANTPGIDTEWHFLLVNYASAIIMMSQDKGIADRLFSNWEEGRTRFMQSMARKHKRNSVNQKVSWYGG